MSAHGGAVGPASLTSTASGSSEVGELGTCGTKGPGGSGHKSLATRFKKRRLKCVRDAKRHRGKSKEGVRRAGHFKNGRNVREKKRGVKNGTVLSKNNRGSLKKTKCCCTHDLLVCEKRESRKWVKAMRDRPSHGGRSDSKVIIGGKPGGQIAQARELRRVVSETKKESTIEWKKRESDPQLNACSGDFLPGRKKHR